MNYYLDIMFHKLYFATHVPKRRTQCIVTFANNQSTDTWSYAQNGRMTVRTDTCHQTMNTHIDLCGQMMDGLKEENE